ncbi:MAG: class I SAM-dependent methyltransferase [Planctomycetota bacterium]
MTNILSPSRTPNSMRKELYDCYASRLKGLGPSFDPLRAKRWAKAYRAYLRGWLPPSRDAAILDAGCGQGWMLAHLADLGYANLYGVDISAEQVALARQVVPDVHEGDAGAYLEAHPERFDIVLAMDLLEHFERSEILSFLSACRRALKPGGRLILQTPNPESPFAGEVVFGDLTHETALSPSALRGVLRLAGFDDIRFRETGPAPHGVLSSLRWCAWKCLRLGILFWNCVETGGAGSGICTRVYLASALKAR